MSFPDAIRFLASGGPISFRRGKKSEKESRQRGPIPRRSPLESLPDGQGRNRAAVSPIGSSFRGRRTGDLHETTGPGDICGDEAACWRDRSNPCAGASKGTLKSKRLLPSRFKVGKPTFSTRLFIVEPLPPSLQRPAHRGCRGTPLPRSFPGFSRERETGPPEASSEWETNARGKQPCLCRQSREAPRRRGPCRGRDFPIAGKVTKGAPKGTFVVANLAGFVFPV